MGPASTSRGKKKEKEYKYTKLSELPPNSKATNVYGVIRHLSHCKDIKMVLYDESEIPTYCELALNNTASSVYGNFPLSTDMIVRIHRCPTKVLPNGQKILYGTIGNAGLHILAWCIDDDNYTVRCKTSINFTIIPKVDYKLINELRQFWKRRMGNDTYGRTIFFHSISNESENNGQERGSQMQEGPTEHHEGEVVEMEANAEQESIDEIVLEEDEEEQEEEEENGEEPETAEESEEIGEDFSKLRTKLAKWKKGDINQFASLLLNQRMEYCNVNCQILSILLPLEQFQHNKPLPLYLRVSDGTKGSSNGMRIHDTHRIESDLFDNKANYEHFRDYIRLVSIWDEFQPIALQMKPGDIIELRNLHAKISPEFGTHLFSLQGIQNRSGSNVYNRGIKLLERPVENEAIQENEVNKGQEENEPPKKKDKKEGEDELENPDSEIVLDEG